ncbi:GSCOCT00004012001.3-RA-CDS, partial [Cotesia congregata]
DQRDLDEGIKMFYWGEKVSRGIGAWPLAPNNNLFTVFFIYLTVVGSLEYVSLFKEYIDFTSAIDMITEILAFQHIYVSVLMLRVHTDKLRYLITESLKDYQMSAFKNSLEIKIFIAYINKGRAFAKFVITFIATTAISWFFMPLTALAAPVSDNETMQFVVPYRFYIFYKVNDYTTYLLTYISQGPPFFIISTGHITSEGFLIVFAFHLCGRLAILVERINGLKNEPNISKIKLSKIISEHARLLKMGENIRGAFATALLAYLLNGMILLCLIGYQILVNIMTGPNSDLMLHFTFIFATYFIITTFCIVSEQLIEESNSVCEAFWNTEWYNMPRECIYDIIYCINRSQKPLALQAGKFSYFDSTTLTEVTKTSMGYLSVLRNFLTVD